MLKSMSVTLNQVRFFSPTPNGVVLERNVIIKFSLLNCKYF